MSNIVQCDHCKAEHRKTSDQISDTPPGWYSLNRIGGNDTRTDPPIKVTWLTNGHLCSPACLIGFAQAEIKAQRIPDPCDHTLPELDVACELPIGHEGGHKAKGRMWTNHCDRFWDSRTPCTRRAHHAGPHQDRTGFTWTDGEQTDNQEIGNTGPTPQPTTSNPLGTEIPQDQEHAEYLKGNRPDPRD